MIKRIQQFLVVIILMPVFAISVYIGQMMTDRYATEASIMIKRHAQGPSVTGLGAALGLGDLSATEDERLLLAYIHSPDLLLLLDEDLNLRSHYSQPSVDRFSRLAPDASREEFLKF